MDQGEKTQSSIDRAVSTPAYHVDAPGSIPGMLFLAAEQTIAIYKEILVNPSTLNPKWPKKKRN